jgi:predicted enzyme related to lactoylglutathione lyase
MKTSVHTVLRVSTLERSLDFYARLFDIKIRVRTDEWAELEAGGTKLLLLKKENEELRNKVIPIPSFPPSCYLGVDTDDLDTFHSRLVSLGARCIQAPIKQKNGDRTAIYADPDGLALQVTEFDKCEV